MKCLIKALEPLKCFKLLLSSLLIKNWYFTWFLEYKQILLISGWWFIRLNNEFAFPDPEPLIVHILYGWSRICGRFGICYFMFSFVTSSKSIIFLSFYYVVTLNTFFSFTRSFSVSIYFYLIDWLHSFIIIWT